jgi:hypothetical protein
MGSGYPNLHSENDVPLVRGALWRHGFEDIRVLKDSMATRAAILAGIRSLTARADRGDIVAIHYAGHGVMITDNNGDELDGYDEAIVPYAAPNMSAEPKEVQNRYDGSEHIRDDELGILLDSLRLEVGSEGSVTVFLDACFSGTGTRAPGELPVRGVPSPIGDPAGNRTGREDETRTGGLDEFGPATRGQGGVPAGITNQVVISAAGHWQPAWEVRTPDGEFVGPLAHALAQTLPRLRRGDSYRTLHRHLSQVMQSTRKPNTPQVEGNADLQVFGGEIADSGPWLEVDSIVGDRAYLAMGLVHGLHPGSEITLYDGSPNTGDSLAALAAGHVLEAKFASSIIALGESLSNPPEATRIRAVVTRHESGDQVARIMFASDVAEPTRIRLIEELRSIWTLSIAEDGADARIEETPEGLIARTIYDGVVVAGPSPLVSSGELVEFLSQLRTFSRNAFLQKLNPQTPEIDVTLLLVPATHRSPPPGQVCRADQSDTLRFRGRPLDQSGSDWVMEPSDHYLLRVKNNRPDPVFFTILDLRPGGQIWQAFPRPRHTPSEARLRANEELLVPVCYQVDPGEVAGIRTVKLFATQEPIDLEPLTTRGPGGADVSNMHPLERLLAKTYRSRRSDSPSLKGMASTSSVRIQVVEPGGV